MEGVIARDCKFSIYYGDLGLFCEKQQERISAINADKECLLCNQGEKEELSLVRHSRKSQYNSLNKCFFACGAPWEYCYTKPGSGQLKRREANCGNASIYNNEDGSRKGQKELLKDLKRFYMATIREIHPDINPYSERIYFDNESKEVTAAYQQGVKLINYRFGM